MYIQGLFCEFVRGGLVLSCANYKMGHRMRIRRGLHAPPLPGPQRSGGSNPVTAASAVPAAVVPFGILHDYLVLAAHVLQLSHV